MSKDVRFDPVNGPINDQIDEAYRVKYKGSPYLSPIHRCTSSIGNHQDLATRG
jgi:hypothetical protein